MPGRYLDSALNTCISYNTIPKRASDRNASSSPNPQVALTPPLHDLDRGFAPSNNERERARSVLENGCCSSLILTVLAILFAGGVLLYLGKSRHQDGGELGV
jgi:hypothetical protein